MRKFIFSLFLLLPFSLYSVVIDDVFVYPEKFKTTKFYYPVITLNSEIGKRFAFNPFEDLTEEDYQTIDAYSFYLGYIKLMQQITKESKVNIFYMYKEKKYETTSVLDNKSATFKFSVVYKILPDISANLGVRYKDIDFLSANEKDGDQLAPEMEIRFKPRKEFLLGVKYVYLDMKYNDYLRNSTGNRVLIYLQEKFYDNKFRLRIRYRGENRKYEYPTLQRKSSTKHSVSATAIIDFN